jgi:O-antigen/teichoic acid export membrane protein
VNQTSTSDTPDLAAEQSRVLPLPGRTRNALISSFFTYLQFAVALGAAFFVTPLILRKIGARDYGLWLSSGELVGYLLLLDFGVLAILPWLIARADGQKRTLELKRHLAQGFSVAVAVSAILLLVAITCGGNLPAFLHLTTSDWNKLRGPLFLLVVLFALTLPAGIFGSLLNGLQDVKFNGSLNLARSILAPVITVLLLLTGHGFYALALGAACLSPVVGIVALFRGRAIAPELLRNWPRPTFRGAAHLLRESIGAWLAGAGVQLMERSSAVILTFLRFPAAVPVLVCTSRLGQTLTQMAWVMPDGALIGYAQLAGENKAERTREVALSIIKLNIVLAGMAGCAVLAINPAFVRIWVGPNFFGGLLLNFLLAAEVISASLVHSLATVVGVQGHRLQIGAATLLQGVVFIAVALILSRRFLLEGLLAADLVAPLFSTIPTCLWLLRSSLGLSLRRLGGELASILFLRAGPCLLGAWAYGFWRAQTASFPELAAVGLLIGFIYLRLMAPQIATFPLPAGAALWLRRLRLV